MITEGIFEPTGGILILKGELNDDPFVSDPAVQHGIISVDRKKLWIAKGSFCERKVRKLSEKIIYFEINFIHDKTKIIDVLNKVQMINVNYKQFAIFIISDPAFIMFIQLP